MHATITPRLLLAPTRASRAVLDGAWWPRSWDTSGELSGLVHALSERYGRIRSVILNASGWTGRVRRLAVAGDVLRIGWFSSMSTTLLVATTDTGDQIDLLLVSPHFAPELAEQAMAQAADPTNVEHAPDLLARIAATHGPPEPPHAAAVGTAEADWEDEGGSIRPAGAGPGGSGRHL